MDNSSVMEIDEENDRVKSLFSQNQILGQELVEVYRILAMLDQGAILSDEQHRLERQAMLNAQKEAKITIQSLKDQLREAADATTILEQHLTKVSTEKDDRVTFLTEKLQNADDKLSTTTESLQSELQLAKILIAGYRSSVACLEKELTDLRKDQ